jgi:hypothetical protein
MANQPSSQIPLVNTARSTPPPTTGATNGLFAYKSGLKTDGHNIGEGTPYHVDIKFPKINKVDVDYDKAIEIMDAMARNREGFKLEFSNGTVAGKQWNPDASKADKITLLKDAFGQHNSQYEDWESIDFFLVSQTEKSRWDETVKSQRNIPIALAAGWNVTYETGGGYGNHAIVTDAQGKVVYKIGHGGADHDLPQSFTVTPAIAQAHNASQGNVASATTATPASSTGSLLAAMKEKSNEPPSLTKIYDERTKGADSTDTFFMQMMVMAILALFNLKDKAPPAEAYATNPNIGRETLEAIDRQGIAKRPDPQKLNPIDKPTDYLSVVASPLPTPAMPIASGNVLSF